MGGVSGGCLGSVITSRVSGVNGGPLEVISVLLGTAMDSRKRGESSGWYVLELFLSQRVL